MRIFTHLIVPWWFNRLPFGPMGPIRFLWWW